MSQSATTATDSGVADWSRTPAESRALGNGLTLARRHAMRRALLLVVALGCTAADCRQPSTGELGNVDYGWHTTSPFGDVGGRLAAHGGRARMDLTGHEKGCISARVDVA